MEPESSELERRVKWIRSEGFELWMLTENHKLAPVDVMQQSLDYLVETVGLEKEEIKKHLVLLTLDALKPNAENLKRELGFNYDAIREYPEVLAISQKDVKLNSESLKRELGFNDEAIRECPELLAISHKDQKRNAERLKKETGLDYDAIRKYPELLTKFDAYVRSNARYLKKELDFSNDIMGEYPELLTKFQGELKGNVKHLLNEWGFDKAELRESPYLLKESLKGCIEWRLIFLRYNGRDIFSPMVEDITDTDSVFCERYKLNLKEYKSSRKRYVRTGRKPGESYRDAHYPPAVRNAAILKGQLRKAGWPWG